MCTNAALRAPTWRTHVRRMHVGDGDMRGGGRYRNMTQAGPGTCVTARYRLGASSALSAGCTSRHVDYADMRVGVVRRDSTAGNSAEAKCFGSGPDRSSRLDAWRTWYSSAVLQVGQPRAFRQHAAVSRSESPAPNLSTHWPVRPRRRPPPTPGPWQVRFHGRHLMRHELGEVGARRAADSDDAKSAE